MICKHLFLKIENMNFGKTKKINTLTNKDRFKQYLYWDFIKMISRHYKSTEFITGLRFIAIFMVFLIHSGKDVVSEILTNQERLVSLGKYGVMVFFVISGFTIFFEKNYSFKS